MNNWLNLSAPAFLLLHVAVVMSTWKGSWEKRGSMNITYVNYLATWLAFYRCSEMLVFIPPSHFLGLWLLHLSFCLTLINYKPVLRRQINHPERKCSHWLSFRMVGLSGRALTGFWPWRSGGFPVNAVSSRPSPGLFWVYWFQSKFPQLLGQAVGWGLGKWGSLRK